MDAFVMVDWSAASSRGPVEGRSDGLWAAMSVPGQQDDAHPFRTRAEARDWLVARLTELVDQGHHVLCGMDVAFGYPAGTAAALGMPAGHRAWHWTWERIARAVTDRPDGTNDRFAAAAELNRVMGGIDGPFWGNGLSQDLPKLPRTKGTYPAAVADQGRRVEPRLAEFRLTERRLREQGHQPKSVWQLSGAGSVGGQVLVGLPTLWRIRNHPALRDRCRVWPFEDPLPGDQPSITLAEVYPSLLPDDPALDGVRDARQVLALVDGYRQMARDGTLADALQLPEMDAEAHTAVVEEEGWILPVTRDPERASAASRRRPADPPTIPQGLIEAIRDGRCVAFVGAGFAAPEVPVWSDLVTDLAAADELPDPIRRQVAALVSAGTPSGQVLEAAAQMIADGLPAGQLRALLHDRLTRAIAEQSDHRRGLLGGIPLESIVTTNLDPGLPGPDATALLPGPEAYASLLRPPPAPWWHERHWQVVEADRAAGEDGGGGEEGGATFQPQLPPVLKLHGDVGAVEDDTPVVFTTQDYRRRLFAEGGYLTFLRSLLATRTILYLGVSFSDAYLNQVRSEVLALVGHDPLRHPPLGYAVLPDVSPEHQAFYRAREGIEVIGYGAHGQDHSGFDEVLAAVHDQAGHDAQLRRAVAGRRILWVDPAAGRNAPGIRRLAELVDGAVLRADGVDDAAAILDQVQVDLVITHWGHRPGATPVGEEVLARVRSSPHPCPVLVFAWGDYADENRPRALALGATDYVWTWPALFRELARVLAPAPRHPWDLAPRLESE